MAAPNGAATGDHGTVVVTGGSSGIGAAVAARLVADGSPVVVVDQDPSAEVVVDLARASQRRRAVEEVAASAPSGIRALVAAAGVSAYGARSGSEVARINHFGAVGLADLLRPALAADGGGAVVLVGSASAVTAPDVDLLLVELLLDGDGRRAAARADRVGPEVAYSSAKFALTRWARRQAPTERWAGAGITLNVIAPGLVRTPLIEEMARDPRGAKILDRYRTPLGREVTTTDVAAVACFLLGPGARSVTGAVLSVDGGTESLLRPDDWPTARTPAATVPPPAHRPPAHQPAAHQQGAHDG